MKLTGCPTGWLDIQTDRRTYRKTEIYRLKRLEREPGKRAVGMQGTDPESRQPKADRLTKNDNLSD